MPHNTFMAIASPAFNASLERLRNDPVTGPQFANMPSNSIGVIDAVTKDMLAQGKQAANSSIAGLNPLKASILNADADLARNVAGRTEPAYAQALALQQLGRANVLSPLEASSAGAIANTPVVDAQTRALFPSQPNEGLPGVTANTIQLLEKQIPGSAAALVRQHLANQFAESAQTNIGVPNQAAGAKFASSVSGNPQQGANLAAGLNALSNGATAAPAVSNLLDILNATGRRQALGSQTATDTAGMQDMARGGVLGNTVASLAARIPGNPLRLAPGISASVDRALIGSRAGDLAQVLLGVSGPDSFARTQAAKDAMPTIGGIFAKGMGQADASQQ